jgi:two-component system sensor histidine kinase BarA
MSASSERSLDELILGRDLDLEDLVDPGPLGELVQSFQELFGVPLRIYSEQGKLLADAAAPQELYRYLDGFFETRTAVQQVVNDVRSLRPEGAEALTHPCVTGAVYRVAAIHYDARSIGRMIFGPFVPPTLVDVPQGLLELEPALDADRIRGLLDLMPHSDELTTDRLAGHLAKSLDLILFSGHKALLTSSVHLTSVRESYRELTEKNTRLQQAYDRLKELDRLKSNFLATVSHELRTPLTSIIGYSEMLAEGIAGEMSQEQRDFVMTIREKGEQLLGLIKGLLDLSKLESGTMNLRKGPLNVVTLVRDVAQTMAPSARKKNIELGTDVERALPELWGDVERLRQVLLNLIENALKFTPSGGSVCVAARTGVLELPRTDDEGLVLLGGRRRAVQISVADTGIGIPAAERDRVFDAFYQIDSSSTREHGGTGLGLSIVKRLIDAHDGMVRIEDNVPRGSIFIVTLPLKRATLS